MMVGIFVSAVNKRFNEDIDIKGFFISSIDENLTNSNDI